MDGFVLSLVCVSRVDLFVAFVSCCETDPEVLSGAHFSSFFAGQADRIKRPFCSFFRKEIKHKIRETERPRKQEKERDKKKTKIRTQDEPIECVFSFLSLNDEF